MRVVASNPAYQTYLWFASFWLEAVFHRSMGEHYMLKDNYKALTSAFLIPIGLYFEPVEWIQTTYSYYFFILVSARILMELARLSVAKLRNRAPHLYSMGKPFRLWLFIFPNLNIVSRVIEPLIGLVLGIALIATETDKILGYILVWASVGMGHKYFYLDRMRRLTRKDMEDRKREVS